MDPILTTITPDEDTRLKCGNVVWFGSWGLVPFGPEKTIAMWLYDVTSSIFA